jgi:hypothetical protein
VEITKSLSQYSLSPSGTLPGYLQKQGQTRYLCVSPNGSYSHLVSIWPQITWLFPVNENRRIDSKVILKNAALYFETSLGKNGFETQIITVRNEELEIFNLFHSAVTSPLRMERYIYIYSSVKICDSCWTMT